ncbi:SDR family NAD(P)-dependent oxidoreductase [Nocardioides lentus]|uniref:SDR family NAD(P)-dependent oxidoreductase n=1 Tax=Nocardioides lentus TaxID=338077 RepID=A0ABN2PHK1_9ACTN
MTHPADRPATWFVTGASRGLGLALVAHLLRDSQRVAATTRSADRLLTALDGLGDVDTSGLLALEVQLTDEQSVRQAVDRARSTFGDLDVVVNNAGYGFLGAVEETSDADVQGLLDVQVRGTWNVIRAALPGMREAGSGHIINISSILGMVTFPGWALYCAGKFALEGLSEALAAEVADLGIRVTVVEPGYFDTDFLTGESITLPTRTTDAYPGIREMTAHHLAMPGSQIGDPAKAAAALVEITRQDGPLRQQLGSDAYRFALAKVDALAGEVAAGRDLAHTTDY